MSRKNSHFSSKRPPGAEFATPWPTLENVESRYLVIDGRTTLKLLTGLALIVPFAAIACSDKSGHGGGDSAHSDADRSGEIGLALQLRPGITINTVTYAITG